MKLKEKENLIQQIGMKFDDAVELFSEETLLSMSMVNIVGGANSYCNDTQCADGCQNDCKCNSSGGIPWSTIATIITAAGTIVSTILKSK